MTGLPLVVVIATQAVDAVPVRQANRLVLADVVLSAVVHELAPGDTVKTLVTGDNPGDTDKIATSVKGVYFNLKAVR